MGDQNKRLTSIINPPNTQAYYLLGAPASGVQWVVRAITFDNYPGTAAQGTVYRSPAGTTTPGANSRAVAMWVQSGNKNQLITPTFFVVEYGSELAFYGFGPLKVCVYGVEVT